jgi:RPA family protein
MESDNKSFFRFPAVKVAIRDLEEGEYIEEKEQNPNYIIIKENIKLFRLNIIATLVHKELRGSVTSILIDDGTGKIVLRLFEENKAALNLEIGDVVQIIGKVRVFNQEKYIFPEIIKKINSSWLKVRALELQVKKQNDTYKNAKDNQKNIEEPLKVIPAVAKKVVEEKTIDFQVVSEEIEENDPLLPFEKLSQLIAQLDKGEGVLIEEVIEKSPLEKTEELIEKMLENGDIFQNLPGKIRLL